MGMRGAARRGFFSAGTLFLVTLGGLLLLLLIGTFSRPRGGIIGCGLLQSKVQVTLRDLDHLAEFMTEFRMTVGRWPETLEEMTVPQTERGDEVLLDSIPQDPWGHDYRLAFSDTEAWLLSLGADGAVGGEEDAADLLRIVD